MATIRNTITMTDRMSPALRSIIKALESTVSALASVDNVSEQAFQQARRDAQNAANAIHDLSSNVDDLQGPVQRATSGFSKWQSAIITANQALQLVQRAGSAIVGGLYTLSDMTDMQARLKRMAGDQMSVYALQDMIAQAADETRSSYTATASSVMSMYNNLKAVGVTQQQSVRLAEILNKQLGADSVKGAQLESVVYQLGQSLASGRLRYEDWKLVLQNAPGMVERVANAAGKTTAEFNAMVSAGTVSAGQFAQYLMASGEEIDKMYDEMPDTFYDQMNRLKTAAYNAVVGPGGIQDIISNALTSDTWNNVLEQLTQVIRNFFTWVGDRVQQVMDWLNNSQVQNILTRIATGIGIVATVAGLAIEGVINLVGAFTWLMGVLQPLEPIVWGIVAGLSAYVTVTKVATAVTLIHTAVTKGVAIVQAAFNTVLAFANVFWMALTGSQYAATAATLAFNGALTVTQILILGIVLAIIAVIVIIFAVVAIINKVTGSTISALGVIVGSVFAAGAAIWNIIVGVVNAVIQFLWTNLIEPWISIVEWVLNVFNGGFDSFGDAVKNLLGNIISWFLSLGKVVTKIIDAIFGTDWTAGLESLQSSVLSWGKNENAITLDRTAPEVLKRIEYGAAYDAGYSFGEKAQNWVGNQLSKLTGNITGMENAALDSATNSGDMLDLMNGDNGGVKTNGTVTIDDESIKLMKDVAAAEWVNKYTTLRPEMTVTFGDVHETADANKLLETMETMIAEAYASALTS